MLFCPKCGGQLSEGEEICSNCANEVRDIKDTVPENASNLFSNVETEKQEDFVQTSKGYWKVLSAISFCISAIIVGLGLDKMFIYSSGDFYPYEIHNAYVGGDAYNYIINGTYATAFFVLAAMFAILGIGFIFAYYLAQINCKIGERNA